MTDTAALVSDDEKYDLIPISCPIYTKMRTAEQTKAKLQAEIVVSGELSISRYYEIIGRPHNILRSDLVWSDISESTIDKLDDGRFILRLPNPEYK